MCHVRTAILICLQRYRAASDVAIPRKPQSGLTRTRVRSYSVLVMACPYGQHVRNLETTMKELSRRQRMILEFIETFLIENDYPPTIRDIQHELGISSTSV